MGRAWLGIGLSRQAVVVVSNSPVGLRFAPICHARTIGTLGVSQDVAADVRFGCARGPCGTYAAAKNVFISRLGNLGVWSPASGKTSTWARLRSDCWLSTIPASGMILSPEGGGGCSCGGWFETSIVFAPQRK
ncbi:MAG: hypothetical protein IID44_11435 [Planctomycetes bacterium]|nr:hypothetical protein [Planctomycetota bacterium]